MGNGTLNTVIEYRYFIEGLGHNKGRVFGSEVVKGVENSRRKFLKESVVEEERDIGVERNGCVNEFRDHSFDEARGVERLDGHKVLEGIANEFSMLLESRFCWHNEKVLTREVKHETKRKCTLNK